MRTVLGGIDERQRPVVRLLLADRDESFLALVDTGFNGELYVTDSVALRLGFERTSNDTPVRLAGDKIVTVVRSAGRIKWLGRELRVQVLIAADTGGRQIEGEPDALLGTGLLSPHILLVDFTAMTVEIEPQ